MAAVTFPPELGGDGKTYSDDADPTTGLDNNGHLTRFIPTLQGAVAMAQTAKNKAGESASSAATALQKASEASTDRQAVATDRAAVQTLRNEATTARDQAQASQTAAAGSASVADADRIAAAASETAAAASAASAATDAQRAEDAAEGLLGRRTVQDVGNGYQVIGDAQSGYHYRFTGNDLGELELSQDALLGATVHAQARGPGLVGFYVRSGSLRGRGGLRHITERDGMVTAVKTGATEWSIAGDLGAVQTQTEQLFALDGDGFFLLSGAPLEITRTVAA